MLPDKHENWGSLPAGPWPGSSVTARRRRLGEEYRLARHAETLLEERETLGHAWETDRYREEHGPRLSFRQWLKEERQDATA